MTPRAKMQTAPFSIIENASGRIVADLWPAENVNTLELRLHTEHIEDEERNEERRTAGRPKNEALVRMIEMTEQLFEGEAIEISLSFPLFYNEVRKLTMLKYGFADVEMAKDSHARRELRPVFDALSERRRRVSTPAKMRK